MSAGDRTATARAKGAPTPTMRLVDSTLLDRAGTTPFRRQDLQEREGGQMPSLTTSGVAAWGRQYLDRKDAGCRAATGAFPRDDGVGIPLRVGERSLNFLLPLPIDVLIVSRNFEQRNL